MPNAVGLRCVVTPLEPKWVQGSRGSVAAEREDTRQRVVRARGICATRYASRKTSTLTRPSKTQRQQNKTTRGQSTRNQRQAACMPHDANTNPATQATTAFTKRYQFVSPIGNSEFESVSSRNHCRCDPVQAQSKLQVWTILVPSSTQLAKAPHPQKTTTSLGSARP